MSKYTAFVCPDCNEILGCGLYVPSVKCDQYNEKRFKDCPKKESGPDIKIENNENHRCPQCEDERSVW